MKAGLISKNLKSYLLLLLMLNLPINTLFAEDISNPVNVGDIETTSSPKEDWVDLNYFPLDDNDDIPPSESNRINWKVATMADDEFNLFVYYENNYSNISSTRINGSRLGFSWGFQVFLDTDDSADTGFQLSNVVGADYIVEGNMLMKYEGDGSNWNWSTIGSLASNYYGNKVEYKISRISIGNPHRVKAVFQGSNESFGGQTTDLYPNGAFDESATTRYFSYALTDSPDIGENNPPVLIDQTFIIPKNRAERGFNLHGTDADDQYLTYEIITKPQNGSFYFKRFGEMYYVIFYAPNQGFIGQDTLIYKASDSIDETRVATITFNVVEDNSTDSYSNLVDDESMIVDANLNEWATVTPFPDRSLVNTSNPSKGANWLNASFAHSEDNLYISYRNRNPIAQGEDSGTYVPWLFQAFLDTDQNNSTGYLLNDGIAAEYMIEGNYLYIYNGNGRDWVWQELSSLDASFINKNAEISVPRNLINFETSSLNIYFVGNYPLGNNFSSINYPVTTNHYFQYNVGTGASASEMNIANSQEGLSRSPLSHQPEVSYSIENDTNDTNTSSGGGSFNHWFMLLVVSLLVTRRKYNATFR